MSHSMKTLLALLIAATLCCATVTADPPTDEAVDGTPEGTRSPSLRPTGRPPVRPGPGPGPGGHEAGHGRGPNGRRPELTPLTDEQEAELLDFIQRRMPGRYDSFVDMAEDNPQHYEFVMSRMWGWYQEWLTMPPQAQLMSIREHDLRMESFIILRRWRDAESEEEKEQIREELRDVLEQHFDVEQELRELQLVELERRLEQVRQNVRQQAADRDTIVSEHLERMLQYRPRRSNAEGSEDTPADESTEQDESDGDN